MSEHEFPHDDIPVIRTRVDGSEALQSYKPASECDECKCIFELMDAVDTYIPTPERDVDKPFLMPVEDVFTITGRGTVATGRVERGTLKLQETVEIVGLTDEKRTTVVTGIEMFRKLLDFATTGDNVGVLLRGVQRDEIERSGSAKPEHQPHPLQLWCTC